MVLTEEGLTDEWSLECGVPQGEVLSPLRFVAIMDILAIWLAKRANGANPTGASYGYKLQPTHQKRGGLSDGVYQPTPNMLDTEAPLSIFARFFCDDILLIGKTKEEVQDMLGVVNEFMTFIDIPINVKKSKYSYRKCTKLTAAHKKPKMPSHESDGHETKLISGGHLHAFPLSDGPLSDAPWIPPLNPAHLDYSKVTEANRYLGVWYALDGRWEHQAETLTEKLKLSLASIQLQNLTLHQLGYVLNALVIPRMAYPLKVTSILAFSASAISKTLDKTIASFVIKYIGCPVDTNHQIIWAPVCQGGYGFDSVHDVSTATCITETMSTLCTANEHEYWQTSSTESNVPSRLLSLFISKA